MKLKITVYVWFFFLGENMTTLLYPVLILYCFKFCKPKVSDLRKRKLNLFDKYQITQKTAGEVSRCFLFKCVIIKLYWHLGKDAVTSAYSYVLKLTYRSSIQQFRQCAYTVKGVGGNSRYVGA